jgi:hypothetical protein
MTQQRTVSLILRAAALSLALYALLAPAALLAADSRIFEMRIYTANDGKLDALNARFRNHTNQIFVRHGMSLIGYWSPTESPQKENTLIYILAYPSMAAREKAWAAFRDDPDWQKAKAESEKGGVLVKNVESKFMTATDYSPIH